MNKLMNNDTIPFYLIESFIAAVEEVSFEVAAQKISLTQSALSRQMLLLEELLPHKVFTLRGRKKVLTPYGQTLYELLAPRFAQTQQVIKQASLIYSEPGKTKITICGRGELLDIVAAQVSFPGRIDLIQKDNDSTIEAVLNRNCDIGIVHSTVDSSELMLRPFISNSFKLAIPKKYINSRKLDSQLIHSLSSMPCLLYKIDDSIISAILREWDILPKDLRVSRVYSNYSTLAKLVDEGTGWSILPSHIPLKNKDTITFPIKTSASLNKRFYLCYRKELTNVSWFKNLLLSLNIENGFKDGSRNSQS